MPCGDWLLAPDCLGGAERASKSGSTNQAAAAIAIRLSVARVVQGVGRDSACASHRAFFLFSNISFLLYFNGRNVIGGH